MSSQNTAIGAIGSLLGYIGAEGANANTYQRLLWPQRAYSGFGWRHVVKIALLAPTGGPIYKAALDVLDKAFAYGLLRGSRLGNMLGTAFFPEMPATYTLHSNDPEVPSQGPKPARNCIWDEIAQMLSHPSIHRLLFSYPDLESAVHVWQTAKAQISVHHITFTISDLPKTAGRSLDVNTNSTRASWRIFAGTMTSEMLGIVFAVVVAVVCRSWLAILWLLPLLVKLLTAAAALERQNLVLHDFPFKEYHADNVRDFEVHVPIERGNFLLLTGPPGLILQFFRHFGHPVRHRFREVFQLVLVVGSACIFPLGLVFSVTIMPLPIQYTWLSYQLYLALVMYITRYLSLSLWGSTQETIARTLAAEPDGAYLWHDPKTGKAVKGVLRSTVHARYGEAKDSMKRLVERHSRSDDGQPEISLETKH